MTDPIVRYRSSDDSFRVEGVDIGAPGEGGGGSGDIVDDTTPQLGGDLDVNGQSIVSVSDGNIVIEPDGTGNVQLLAADVLIEEDLAHAGDTDCAIRFATDSIALRTGDSSRLDVSDSGVRMGGANSRVTTILDQDDMSSDSATALATQQSIKAYVDNLNGVFDSPLVLEGGSYALDDGADTITLSAPYFALTGSAGESFTITLADGTTTGQTVMLAVTGDPGEFTVDIEDEATTTIIGAIRANHIYQLRWSGSTWFGVGRALRNVNPLRAEDLPGTTANYRGAGSETLTEALAAVVSPTMAQWRIAGRTSSGTGELEAIDITALTEKTSIHNDDLVLMSDSEASGAFKKVKKSNLSSAAASPSVTTATMTESVFALSDATRFHPEHVIILANEAGEIQVPDDASAGDLWKVHATTSMVIVAVEGDAGSVNGSAGGSVTLAGNGATTWVFVLSNAGTAPVVIVEGETTAVQTMAGDLDAGGNEIYGNLAKVETDSGSLTAAQSGEVIVTSGNITIPTTAGFNCTLIAGGAHTVSFNSTTSSAMAAGDIMSIVVEDSDSIHAVLTAAADKVAFS